MNVGHKQRNSQAEDEQIFELLNEAHEKYANYLKYLNSDLLDHECELVFPQPSEYRLDRPTGYCTAI